MSASVISASGSVKKQVTCESCGHRYDYEMSRTADGTYSGLALTRAKADELAAIDATEKLTRILETDCDVVPCPRCGALTRQMLALRDSVVPTCLGGLVLGLAIVGLVSLAGSYTGRWYYVMGLIGKAFGWPSAQAGRRWKKERTRHPPSKRFQYAGERAT